MAIFDLLGRRWAMGVVWQLSDGPRSFSELQSRCDSISPTILSTRLKDLAEARWRSCYRATMKLMPPLTLAFWNAWLLCLPMVLCGGVSMALRRDLTRRLSNMTGYTSREKTFTVAASMLPYPFMAIAAFTPFVPTGLLFSIGLLVAVLGNAGFATTLFVFASGSSDQPLRNGPYRVSRNPLYVSASLLFLGVCMSTGSLLLSAILAVLLVLQHAMILAEERACTRKYGEPYIGYARRVPRYLVF